MKIQIRFEEGTERDDAEEFLNSLGLDPARWLEDQTLETVGRGPARIFGMPLPLDAEEMAGVHAWICSIGIQEGSKRFLINDQLQAARILPDYDIQIAISALTQSLSMLSLAELNITVIDEFIESLPNLTSLNLSGCKSLIEVRGLSTLARLANLNLTRCESLEVVDIVCKSLNELSGLEGLVQLKVLRIRRTRLRFQFDTLTTLRNLVEVKLDNCNKLPNLSPFSCLTHLSVLELRKCENLKDLSGVSACRILVELTLLDCRDLESLDGVEEMQNLERLAVTWASPNSDEDMAKDRGLISLAKISSLKNLKTLKIGNARKIENLEALGRLLKIEHLVITECDSLINLTPIIDLINLKGLNLGGCKSLQDLSALTEIKNLEYLDLSFCKSLSDVHPLKALTSLKTLSLDWCEKIHDITPLSDLHSLSNLSIRDCNRIRSCESLREIYSLESIRSNFNPPEVAEILAHAAAARHDHDSIMVFRETWLQEAIGWVDGPIDLQDRFASTLGEAFSIIGESDVEFDYEHYLQRKANFSSAPWVSWLRGTLENSGPDLLRRRVNRQIFEECSPGCIGGISIVISDDAAAAHQDWAREWLEQLESSWQMRAKELLPVSAEVCLAHARLGMTEALRRWLDRFTDPSDPAALDPVQAALGHWQLTQGQIEAATEHAVAVQQPATKDPLLVAIVEASYRKAASRAGELLLMIESNVLRGELAVRLVQDKDFVRSALNMERLIVACGPSVEALARLIQHAAAGADSTHLQALSQRLKQNPQAARDLQRTLSLKLLKELSV